MTSSQEQIEAIVKIGFNEELAKKAYKVQGNNTIKTINFLKKLKKYGANFIEFESDDEQNNLSEDEITDGEDDDPLGFIKSSKEIGVLKNLVQENPEKINFVINSSILNLSMGDLEESTNNQEAFLELLCNEKDLKEIKTINCDEKTSAVDNKNIKKRLKH